MTPIARTHSGTDGLTGLPAAPPSVPGVIVVTDAVSRLPGQSLLPDRPRLAHGPTGVPALSLVLALARPATPDEESVRPLIVSGVLTMDVTLALPEPSPTEDPDDHPLFARSATFELVQTTDGAVLSSASSQGFNARAALQASLNRSQALDALAALDGVATSLAVRATVTYQGPAGAVQLRLQGSWGRVHDALAARFPTDATLGLAELRQTFDELLTTGVLTTSTESGAPAGPERGELFDPFLRMARLVVLRESPPDPAGDATGETRYTLRGRPGDGFDLDVSLAVLRPALRRIVLSAPLEQFLGDDAKGARAQFIQIEQPDSKGRMTTVPRRVRTTSDTARGPADAQPIHLAATGGGLKSVPFTLRPQATIAVSANTLAAADAGQIKVLDANRIKYTWANDIHLESIRPGHVQSLPVVPSDRTGVIWPDRLNPAIAWYPPTFEVMPPDPGAGPEQSSFLFDFERTGATADGRATLTGHVRFTLRQGMPREVEAARNRPRPVPTDGLAVSLRIPFRDQAGAARVESFPGKVEPTAGGVTVTVELLNDWVRLCYGALSQAGFQAEPARLEVGYYFRAYSPIPGGWIKWGPIRKTALLPVVFSPRDAEDNTPYFDAAATTLRFPGGELRLTREPAILAHTAIRPKPGVLVSPPIRPPVKPTTGPTAYVTQTVTRQESRDVLVPCTTHGHLYREKTPAGMVAVGCRDALLLGQTAFRQYEEMPELEVRRGAQAIARVYRSLQQPGRFLVVPTVYLITRYEPTVADRAYRPAIILYSIADDDAERTRRVVFAATLQPDVPIYARRELEAKLRTLSPAPRVEYPTELGCPVKYTWAVDARMNVQVETLCYPDSFGVSLTTDDAGALLVRSQLQTAGVEGVAEFRLADGTVLASRLALRLREVIGPWAAGPVEVAVLPAAVRLTNRIEQRIAVSEVMTRDAGRAAVDSELTPGQSREVPTTAAPGDAYPVYALPSGDEVRLEEIASFVEDIHTNVIFLDLIDHAQHGLRTFDVAARLRGVPGEQQVPWTGSPRVGEVRFTLPLTTYLGSRVLEFRVTRTATGGEATTGPWREWNLGRDGVVIGLTWELVQ